MKKVCKAEGCDKKVFGRGYCSTHYWRLMRNGSPYKTKYEKRGKECSVDGCDAPVYSKGLCHKHWLRKRDYGTTDRLALKQPWRNSENWDEYFQRSTKVDDETGCIEWMGYRDKDGYGRSWNNDLGKSEPAHRLAYKVFVGPIPEGKIICHHCDNPPCVNPDHLYAGTQKTNAEDRDARGRSNVPKGENSAASKLTRENVIEIIRRRKNGDTSEDIASDYGITHWTVTDIMKGNSWRDIDRDAIQGNAVRDCNGRIKNVRTKLSEQDVRQIKADLHGNTTSINKLAERFGVSNKTIVNIRDEKVWKHITHFTKSRRTRK